MSFRGQRRPSCIVASCVTRRKSGERLDRLYRPGGHCVVGQLVGGRPGLFGQPVIRFIRKSSVMAGGLSRDF